MPEETVRHDKSLQANQINRVGLLFFNDICG